MHLLVSLCCKARKCTLLSCSLSAPGSHDVIMSEASSLQKKENKSIKVHLGLERKGLSHTHEYPQLSRSTRLVDLQGLRSWFFSGFGELLLNMNEIQLWKGRCDYEKLSFSFKTPFCSFSCVALLKCRNTFAFLCLLISIAP